MPEAISRRRLDLMNAYGVAGEPWYGMVQEMAHRDVEVLMLYPLDLVAVDQRYGSWMQQFGYANVVSQAKLLEMGSVRDGAIWLGGRRFTTVVSTFEPFPAARLLDLLAALAESGGRVIWSGPPPLLAASGDSVARSWQSLFACSAAPSQELGKMAAGMNAVFEGALAAVAPQTILTHLVPDRMYPVAPHAGGNVVARVARHVVGVQRCFPSGGTATFLGFRPRDDQSCSLGRDERTFFAILLALGAYPPSGAFGAENDNTEYLSRTGSYLTCRFPNGAIAVAPHLRQVEECWQGGFARDEAEDRAALADVSLPSRMVTLHDSPINGHRVDYEGLGAVAFRLDERGDLVAFSGSGATCITIDGRRTVFAEGLDIEIAWAPVSASRRTDDGALLQIRARGEGPVRIPIPDLSGDLGLVAEGAKPGSRGEPIPCSTTGSVLEFTTTAALAGRWLYLVRR
jgi:hypothetical protein